MLHAGAPDPTFGNGGIVEPTLPAADNQIIARQPDGKLLVGGSVSDHIGALDPELYLARYTSSGHLDTSFGSSGRVYTRLNAGESEGPTSIALTASGQILVVLQRLKVAGNLSQPPVLLRYLSNGKLDSSFGNKGVLTIPAPSGAPGVAWQQIAVLSNGELILAGDTGLGADTANYALIRLHSDGTIDTGFGTSANHHVVTTSFGGADHVGSLLIQSDGKILLAGTLQDSTGVETMIAARFTGSGNPDTTFGSGGKDTLVEGSALAATFGAGGSIFLAGAASNGQDDDFAVLKLTALGTIDKTFGASGLTLVNFAGTQAGYAQDPSPRPSELIRRAGSCSAASPASQAAPVPPSPRFGSLQAAAWTRPTAAMARQRPR